MFLRALIEHLHLKVRLIWSLKDLFTCPQVTQLESQMTQFEFSTTQWQGPKGSELLVGPQISWGTKTEFPELSLEPYFLGVLVSERGFRRPMVGNDREGWTRKRHIHRSKLTDQDERQINTKDMLLASWLYPEGESASGIVTMDDLHVPGCTDACFRSAGKLEPVCPDPWPTYIFMGLSKWWAHWWVFSAWPVPTIVAETQKSS